MASNMHVGDVGTVLTLQLTDQTGAVVDISSATALSVIIRRPNNSRLVQAATFLTDGTDGKIRYVLAEGDLDVPGNYKFEALAVFPGGQWYTEVVREKVDDHL